MQTRGNYLAKFHRPLRRRNRRAIAAGDGIETQLLTYSFTDLMPAAT